MILISSTLAMKPARKKYTIRDGRVISITHTLGLLSYCDVGVLSELRDHLSEIRCIARSVDDHESRAPHDRHQRRSVEFRGVH